MRTSQQISKHDGRVELSVIVPLHNEAESIDLLYDSITSAVRELGLDYELLFIDDGSRDRTFELSAALAASDHRLRVVKLRRNYGQTAAMVAGIDEARGSILVTMDGDLQNDPADIGLLVDEIDAGYDIAVGWRHQRHDKFLTRKLPSKIANWLIGKVSGVPIKDNGCSLKAYRGEVIKKVPLYSDMHRFIPAMASVTGARVAQVKVRHHPRRFGVSKYGLWRIYKVLMDLFAVKTVVSFAERPLWWFCVLALPAMIISLGTGLYVVEDFLVNAEYSVVLAGVALMFGSLAVFALLSGLMCELVSKTGSMKPTELAVVTATQPRAHGTDRRKPRS